MKIRIGDIVYVQKYDIRILSDMQICWDLVVEYYCSEGMLIINGPKDALTFVELARDKRRVEKIMSEEWIIEYEQVVNLSIDELKAMYKEIASRKYEKIKDLEENSFDWNRDYQTIKYVEVEKESLMQDSIEFLIDAREGKVEFTFPEGYDGRMAPPEQPKTDETPKKKPGFFARLFRRGAQ